VIFAAGAWATLLIFYRVFDRPNISGEGGTVGIQWGFFVAFMAAGALAVAGQRIRSAGRPEPRERRPVPDPVPSTPHAPPSEARTGVVPASQAHTEVVPSAPPRSRAVTRADAEQLTFENPAEDDDEPPLRPGEIPRARDQR
jgi:hypothetical protein